MNSTTMNDDNMTLSRTDSSWSFEGGDDVINKKTNHDDQPNPTVPPTRTLVSRLNLPVCRSQAQVDMLAPGLSGESSRDVHVSSPATNEVPLKKKKGTLDLRETARQPSITPSLLFKRTRLLAAIPTGIVRRISFRMTSSIRRPRSEQQDSSSSLSTGSPLPLDRAPAPMSAQIRWSATEYKNETGPRGVIPGSWREQAEDTEFSLLQEELRLWQVYERECVQPQEEERGRSRTR
ncbi:hypothetical protein P153DRAFT_412738 [Dothidotthia symphoricarpi CBS 119687]|uniref:Uncharacterized protein n=1 Tax=Dothidotthia symphoricarpi CBS 119687 TaxID=1392245 RepID=A0A6A6AMW9_9PLEO|nr:uncharacterized protein P153DRAFT_412738 [Dothidotthia symphoricarpi CBS 119687]KAF2133130.1 hypothetical protein P153DRAFT_412738 [Dothidotthia symphoricarpi CBS 119687]